ncbi:MAG: 50S ribosomal protein L25, partial [Hyphomicrobiales bacterium]|nr:50S ribosomal protein L25 [Hyphomicrobiales bacterium]
EASPGLKRGGVLNIVHHEIPLVCSAESIPESIDIDLTGLDIGAAIHINDVKLPEGCKTITRENLTLVAVSTPTKLADEPAPAAAAAPAAAPAKAPAKG